LRAFTRTSAIRHPPCATITQEVTAMLQGIALFFVGIGALLVSIVSMLHLAWLAVIIPLTIAGAAAFGVYRLGGRRTRRAGAPRSLARPGRVAARRRRGRHPPGRAGGRRRPGGGL